MMTDELIEKMKQTPLYQDKAFHQFCLHPLAAQVLREIAAGNYESGGKLVEATYDKIWRDLAVAKETGTDDCPWIKEQV
ncbi:MAG: hypothetical protein V3R25_10050 [Nitrosomonadaceae bacterium]